MKSKLLKYLDGETKAFLITIFLIISNSVLTLKYLGVEHYIAAGVNLAGLLILTVMFRKFWE